MATIDISLNIPNDQMPRVLAGLRAHFGQVPDENQPEPTVIGPPGVERRIGQIVMRDRTNAELMAEVKKFMRSWLRNIVVDTETKAAETAARAAVGDVDVT
jgi:hypothetical protein